MTPQDSKILRALVAIAWADRRIAKEETRALETLFHAFGATEAEAKELRAYASRSKSLSDVPLDELSDEDREILLGNAAVLTAADGKRSDEEAKALDELVKLLGLDASKAKGVIDDAKDGAFLLPSRQLEDG